MEGKIVSKSRSRKRMEFKNREVEMMKLFREGRTDKEVAAVYGFNPRWVGRIRLRHGVQPNHARTSYVKDLVDIL